MLHLRLPKATSERWEHFWTPNKSGGEINSIQLSECGSREMWGNNNQVPFGFHGYNLKKNRDSVCHGVRGRAKAPPPPAIPLCPTLTTVHSQRTSWRDQTEGSLESLAFRKDIRGSQRSECLPSCSRTAQPSTRTFFSFSRKLPCDPFIYFHKSLPKISQR